jgi:hypothetical protein
MDCNRSIVARHLEACGTITNMQARDMYGILHIAEYVRQLRAAGMPITTVWQRSSSGRRYGVYTLNRAVTHKEAQGPLFRGAFAIALGWLLFTGCADQSTAPAFNEKVRDFMARPSAARVATPSVDASADTTDHGEPVR